MVEQNERPRMPIITIQEFQEDEEIGISMVGVSRNDIEGFVSPVMRADIKNVDGSEGKVIFRGAFGGF